MEYYDDAGSVAADPATAARSASPTTSTTRWSVDLDPYIEPGIDSVRVSVQKETVSGWATTASLDLHRRHARRQRWRSPRTASTSATTTGASGGRSAPAACRGASTTATSRRACSGAICTSTTPSGVCARMNLRYLTESGAFLTERAGGTVCAPDNGHDTGSASTSSSYASNKIGQVTVQLQTLGLERHLRHGRLADGLDQRVTPRAGLGVPKEFPSPFREGPRMARRLD